MITALDPACIVLVGIGGAKPESEFTLGDVIVGTRVHDFSITAALSGGKSETAIAGQPMHPAIQAVVVNLPATGQFLGDWNSEGSIGREFPAIDLLEENFVGNAAWNARIRDSLSARFFSADPIRRPKVTDGALGSGNVLMKDPAAFEKWLAYARDLKAVEMELPGVVAAARGVKGEIPVLAIRGISDIVGFKRDAAWTVYACHSAAAFTYAFLTAGLLNFPARLPLVQAPDDKGLSDSPHKNGCLPGKRGAEHFEPTDILHKCTKSISRLSSEGLAELDISTTQGSSPDEFDVISELRFGRSISPVGELRVEYGISQALLRLTGACCRLTGPRLGDDHNDPNIISEAGQKWRIVGPLDRGALTRRPIGDKVLCRMSWTDKSLLPSVTLKLSCLKVHVAYNIVDGDEDIDISNTRAKIIGAFIGYCLGDDSGIIDLCIARLNWEQATCV